MDKHFETARNLCLGLNEAHTIAHHAAPRPEWVNDTELHHSLARAALEAIPQARLGVLQDSVGHRVVFPVLGVHWISHRGVHTPQGLIQCLEQEAGGRRFQVVDAPVQLDQARPDLVQIAAESLAEYTLDQSIGRKSIFNFT